MAFEKVCSIDDLWEGDMAAFDINGERVLVIHADGGEVYAVQGICPHQRFELVDGKLEGTALTCSAHLWQFDVKTGAGINPKRCQLACYPAKILDDDVYVNTDGIEPLVASL